jgi:hypothetical protein
MAPTQSAKVTPFADGRRSAVRKKRLGDFFQMAPTQSAKVTPFAGGNEADVRKKRLGDFFPIKSSHERAFDTLQLLGGGLQFVAERNG